MTPSAFSPDQTDELLAAYLAGKRPLSTDLVAMQRNGASQLPDAAFQPGDPDNGPPINRAAFTPSSAQPEAFQSSQPSAAAGKVLLGRGTPQMPPPGSPPPVPDRQPPPGVPSLGEVADAGGNAAGQMLAVNGTSPEPPAVSATTVPVAPTPSTGLGKIPPPPITPQLQSLLDKQQQITDTTPKLIGQRPQDIDQTTGKEKLGAKAGSWAQRLGMAVLAATKLAPYAQQIIHPEYSQEMATRGQQLKDIEQEVTNQEKAENIGYLGTLRTESAQRQQEQGADYAQREKERQASDSAKAQLRADEDFSKTLGPDAVTGLDASDPNLAQLQQQGYHIVDDLRDHRDGVQKMKVAIPPRFMQVTPDNLDLFPKRKAGDLVPWSEYKSNLAAYEKAQQAQAAAGNKPPNAEQEKLTVQGLLQKVAEEHGLTPDAMTDVRRLSPLIDQSTMLTAPEKAHLKTYLTMNPTAAATGSTANIRIAGMEQSRELPVIDTKNQNSPMYLNAADINAANKLEPGRYLPAGVAIPALNKTSLIEDIRGGIQSVRDSLAKIPDFSPQDKVKIAIAMRSADPKSAVANLLQNATAGSMTPDMQDYLINHATLIENAMAMRSVLGAGQGSDDVRAAIAATIPGPSTPNKEYATRQLDKLEQVLNRVGRGVPKVPLRTDTGATGGPVGVPPEVQQALSATKPGIHTLSDGSKWMKNTDGSISPAR